MSEEKLICYLAIGAIVVGFLLGMFVLGDGSDIIETVNQYG